MTTHDPAHRQTWDLIPWLVNGTLDADQRESVDAHFNTAPIVARNSRSSAGCMRESPTT